MNGYTLLFKKLNDIFRIWKLVIVSKPFETLEYKSDRKFVY